MKKYTKLKNNPDNLRKKYFEIPFTNIYYIYETYE